MNGKYDSKELSHVGMSDCFLCGEPKEIILDRRLKNSLPRNAVYNLEPCDKCKGMMKQGVILVAFDPAKTPEGETIKLPDGRGNTVDTHTPNFWRTGGFYAVKDQWIERLLKAAEKADDQPIIQAFTGALKSRVIFVPEAFTIQTGLKAHAEEQDKKREADSHE